METNYLQIGEAQIDEKGVMEMAAYIAHLEKEQATLLEELQQAHDDVKPYYEYINEYGTTEKWQLPNSVEETQKEIMEIITNGKEELLKIEEFRNKAFEILKEHNCEHYV